ncbi:putative PIG3 family NAD(P)H quinone oxidoreductase [Antricoccus suffuscus]|uniref:Putative PIG3 family NAD(P)H quinone oxidoreductase n=1 Tax=Antricoccus suffuscus TaxID=1629062 RepID=A0A2T1A2Z7_9ACTN|nr:NAD(P)H-quinone oxidoreductase [Antricoccus suffuscus]PRZ42973.1 putative PIG3 family NAD(P)H quinone oxidoreductase [Antricoccus suffuscus]
MKAIVVTEPGGPEALTWGDAPDPTAGPDEVVIEVAATAVNRADVMQRMGHYPPPPGASDIIGLECSGTIASIGANVTGWSVGDEVCALLAGGGYAEKVAVPAVQVMPVPKGVDLVSAAALPEVACTVWSNLFAPFSTGQLVEGETLLAHGGSSGIGTMAIQMATAKGIQVIVTVGSKDKADACLALGATAAINYRDEDFVAKAREYTDGKGVDVVLDLIGAKYLERNLDVLAPDGRLVILGMQGGRKAELNIGSLLPKRLSLSAVGLRGRPVTGANSKAEVVAGVVGDLWPLVEAGKIKPIVDRVIPMSDAKAAHERLEGSSHIGKIILSNREGN